ncbi:hypothetical protein Asppvi_009905 [Aspergillus pseudoviridinutans]|uniref:AB hydrolase-1 domain-containing protein n=1 Tax=Aspergillus pseudoviridinutans TaxID=1517512 RepID=A0A9P3EZK6_9EURO|nr:uncharacterized protein Asppvi_009905 [Aspergillus pseudoviridinutans]GIJ90940.1 hypothetical protein Asppvi_009905 [Aspergillus pseudoviridinutans]
MPSTYSKVKELTTASIARVLTALGYLSVFLLSFTINRAFLASAVLPLYLLSIAYSVLPTILWNAPQLLLPNRWRALMKDAEQYRQRADALARSQLEGKYRFKEDEIIRTDQKGKEWMADMPWRDNVEEFNVCGATARYVHLKPSYRSIATDNKASHRPIVFLHGNPSWSYMWRNVFPALVERGHEVYALDWLGHGRSDKITRPEAITFELHMRTLQQFFESTGLENATLVAHDWGGCVALCTLPRLPSSACTGLFLLNSFLPPRLSEISMHHAILYAIWFMTTRILGGRTPESAVMRFMSPSISQKDVIGYAAPYRNLPAKSKSSICRFSHMAPATPRVVLTSLRYTWLWKLVEGLAGPSNFDNLNVQARLSVRDDEIRGFWKSSERARQLEVAVVFGEKDPLLKDCKDLLVRAIDSRVMVDWAPHGIWLDGAGHYPAEEKPKAVGDLIARLARHREPTVLRR